MVAAPDSASSACTLAIAEATAAIPYQSLLDSSKAVSSRLPHIALGPFGTSQLIICISPWGSNLKVHL